MITVDVVKNLERVNARIAQAALAAGRDPAGIVLVAVSKMAPAEAVAKLVEAGHLDYGENRVQDGLGKMEAIASADVRWHLIGRIQTNKVKYISPFYLVHSLDRWELAEKMSEYALRKNLRFHCLVQVNVADDPAKAGIALDEVDGFLARVSKLRGLGIRGLMTITALDAGPGQTRTWFETMAAKYSSLAAGTLPDNVRMDWLSMGMSGDYELAVAAGANMVRVGSAIFSSGGE